MQECFKNYINNYSSNNRMKKECDCMENPQNPSDENKPDIPQAPENSCNQCVVDNIGYAQAYIPYQENTTLMSENESFTSGTVFEALSKPYEKGSALMRFNIKE